MTPPPSACSGVSTSARKSALPMAVSSGSRFMNSAVRNGPMRAVEAKTPSNPVVTARLSTTRASHPERGRGRLPVRCRERGENEYGGRGQERIPSDAQRVGAGKQRARGEQHHNPAERGAEGGKNAGGRERGRMRAEHQREPEKGGDRSRGAPPADQIGRAHV